jgi:hypothetical protein
MTREYQTLAAQRQPGPQLRDVQPQPVLSRIRVFVLWALIAGLLGTGAELLVSGHTEDVLQWAPLGLILFCLLVLLWHALARSAASIRVLQLTMILFIIVGVAGLALHWKGKMEFKREMDPSLTGVELFLEAMKSQSPPALAPGILIQMALLGLIYTYRHPASVSSKDGSSERTASRKTRSTI